MMFSEINSISNESFLSFFSVLFHSTPIFNLYLLNLEFEQMTDFVAFVSFNLMSKTISSMHYLCLSIIPCLS